MKKMINKIAAVALLMGVSTAAMAQTVEDNYPYSFIGLQGGAQATFTNQKFTDLITPQVALSYGRYFNSKVGARLHLQGWQIKSAITDTYKFNAITGDIDLLMNLSNIINPQRSCDKFNWVLLAGFGVNYGWDFDEFNTQNDALTMNPNPYLCGSKHSSFNSRLGMQFNFDLSDKLALGLEVDGNMKNDEFNLKRNYNPDFQVQALVGLTFKLGGAKKPKMVEVEETYYVDEPYTETLKKQRPVESVEVSSVEKVVYYQIRESNPDDAEGINQAINEAANLFKTDPNAKITVTGYADVETGNPEINMSYSKDRAQGVTNKLVNEHGISAANITTDWKGDTVQPFPNDNDKNRCVIIKGQGKFKKTMYEDYEETVQKTRQVAKTRKVMVEKK